LKKLNIMDNFFSDLRVIELANVLAGPAVGMFFSELGAEVIKIENKKSGGDVTRSWKTSAEDPESPVSAYYASINRNKKSFLIDFNDPGEKRMVYDLIRDADIVISNYKTGDDVKLGMDYDTLRKINPAVILATITGFGDNNKRTAYDLVLQAETGFMHMNGTPKSGPLKMPVALIDILAAHQLKEGVLVALIKKLKTGGGSKVTVSLYDSAIASLANQAGNWLMTGKDPQPSGSLHPNIAPYGEIFETADNKKIVLAIGNNKQFEQLCRVLDCTDLLSLREFNSNPERVKNRTKLYEILKSHISTKNAAELMSIFIATDIPAGQVKPLSEVFEDKMAQGIICTGKISGIPVRNVKTSIFKLT
jgi:crotonobetainyl-CoA:carnitine CoA-transferase CaiB-like acyl-CoA transferase